MPAKREAVAHHRLVGDQAAFRIGGGSRCVKHQADVAHAHSDACNVYLQIRDVRARRFEVRVVNESRRLGLAKQHDVAQFWGGRKLQASGVATACQPGQRLAQPLDKIHGVGDRIGGDNGDDVPILDHVGQFAGFVAGVDRHNDAAAERDRKQHLHELFARVHEDADVVASSHAEGLETAGTPHRVACELGIGDFAGWEHERRRVGITVSRAQQYVADGGHTDPEARQVFAVMRVWLAE